MTRQDFRHRFDLTDDAAAELAPMIEAARHRAPVRTAAESRRRIARLPDIAGTLRIEGLTLTPADQRFQTFVLQLGLDDDETHTLMRAYALATLPSKTPHLVPAE